MKQINKKFRITLLLIFLSFLMENCATTSFSYRKLEIEPKVLHQSSSIFSTDSQFVVQRLALTFPGNIEYYEMIDSLNQVVVRYSSKVNDSNFIILYDLGHKKPIWQAEGNFYIFHADKNDLVLKYGYTKNLYDIHSGKFIRSVSWPKSFYTLYFWNSNAMIFDPRNVSFVNLRTGNIKWQRPGFNWDGYLWVNGLGNWFYFTANGLHAININNGNGWDFEASTSHKAYGKYIAKETALTFLYALSGRTYISSSNGPDITHNICTFQPLISDSVIYFAARKKVYKINKNSGTLIWETPLETELGVMDLFKVSNTEIALVGYGIKYVNYKIKLTNNPTLIMINSSSGELTGKFDLQNIDMILDIKFVNNKFYILTPQKFYILDSDLNLLFALDSNIKNDFFGQFKRINGKILIQSYNGLYAISDSSLSELWHKELPPLVNVAEKPKWKFPYNLNEYLDSYSKIINGILFRPSENGYIGISLNSPHKQIVINLKNIIIGDGKFSNLPNYILYSKNNTLLVYSFLKDLQ